MVVLLKKIEFNEKRVIFIVNGEEKVVKVSDDELNELRNLKLVEIYNAETKGINVPDSESNANSILEKIACKLNNVN